MVGGANNTTVVSPPSKNAPTGYPEFAVRRKVISDFFEPPLARSTFHDLVNKGKVVPLKGIRGFYLLNDSLRRLGLREVPSLPRDDSGPSREDLLRMAFAIIDPPLFADPLWWLTTDSVEMKDADHVNLLVATHRAAVTAYDDPHEKVAYYQGALDALLSEGLDAESGGD